MELYEVKKTLLTSIQAVGMIIAGLLVGALVTFLYWIFVIGLLMLLPPIPGAYEKEPENVSDNGLPNIDTEAAYEYLEPGECMGGDIEEKHFSLWICKED
ncbi:hypothetical protein IKS86_04550 [bacterium]|nr:hypothetical protein [bacterium]